MSLLDQLKKQTEELSSFKKQSSSVDTSSLIQGVSIPVKVNLNDFGISDVSGELRIGVIVSPDAVSSPAALKAVIENLSEQFDLASWSRDNSSSSNSGFKKKKY